MKNKKWLLLLIPIVLVLAIVSFLWGNPVSRILVHTRAAAYLDDTYPELPDLEIDSVVYDFKFGGWTVYVNSPTSMDTHFDLRCNGLGTVVYDLYELNVTSGSNTYARHTDGYAGMIDELFTQSNAPFHPDYLYACLLTQGHIAYDTIPGENSPEFITIDKDFSLDPSVMELDQYYDIPELAANHGEINLSIQSEEVSVTKMTELLLDLKEFLDRERTPFYAATITITSPDYQNSIHVHDFLYSDIFEEGLEQRVQDACDEYDAYMALLGY